MLHIFLAALIFAFPASADSARIHAFEKHYQHAQTLKADFYQRYSDGHGAATAESGTVYFSRPGRMRWNYESPEQKVFLVDGKNVWFYVPADHTASRAKMNESSDWRTPLALLAGKADLSRLCRSVEVTSADAKLGDKSAQESSTPVGTVFHCQPKSNSADAGDALREVVLETDTNGRLVRLLIREAGDVETEFRFGNWVENLPIPEATFHFAPPPGVAIVDEATLAGAMH
ncbi:MAG: LolA family protein [Candidatus Acidiferrales bacterium]